MVKLNEITKERGWFILKEGNNYGPFSQLEIIQMLQEKSLFEHDFIFHEKFNNWKCIAEVEDFSVENIRRVRDAGDVSISEVFFRRRHARASYGASLIVHNNLRVFRGKSLEISAGGAGVLIDCSELQPGQSLFLHFQPGEGVPPFNAVCQIVSKLFDAVKPDRAYFGEKDFQQLAIIREMVRQMNYSLEIVGCPIIREEDGLALSSRNARLSVEERKNALKISQTLFESRTFAASHTVAETQKFVEDAIAAAPGLRLEYFELVDGNTLQKIANWEDTAYAVGCITVFCGEVRLIDNIKYKE